MLEIKFQIVTKYESMGLKEAVSHHYDHYPTDEEIKEERTRLRDSGRIIWSSRVHKLYYDS